MLRIKNKDKLESLFRDRDSAIECRRFINIGSAQLDVFETTKSIENLNFQIDRTAILVMLQGEKNLSISDNEKFAFKPGQTVVLSDGDSIDIDFPDATIAKPARCIALTIEQGFVDQTLQYYNTFHAKIDQGEWSFGDNKNLIPENPVVASSVSRLIDGILENDTNKERIAQFRLKELMLQLMQTQTREVLYRDYTENQINPRIAHLTDKIKNNKIYSYNVEELSEMMHLSKSQVFRVFNNEIGMSPTQYINSLKILSAQEMLRNTDLSITEISYLSGFSDIHYFSRYFKEWVGVSPSAYRKANQIS